MCSHEYPFRVESLLDTPLTDDLSSFLVVRPDSERYQYIEKRRRVFYRSLYVKGIKAWQLLITLLELLSDRIGSNLIYNPIRTESDGFYSVVIRSNLRGNSIRSDRPLSSTITCKIMLN